MRESIRTDLEQVGLHFADLEDPRSSINQRHPFVSVVVIALLAVLGRIRWSDRDCQVGHVEKGTPAEVFGFAEWYPPKGRVPPTPLCVEAVCISSVFRKLARVITC